MLARCFIGLIRLPLLTLGLALLLWALAAMSLWDRAGGPARFNLDPSLASLLPATGDALDIYERVRSRYGDDDILLAVWQTPELFSPDALARLKHFGASLAQLPGVVRVDSLATALTVRGSDGIIEIDSLLQQVPVDEAAALRLRDEAMANRLLRGNLLSNDGHAALIAIEIDRGLSPATLFQLVDDVTALSAREAGTIENFVTGSAYARIAISRLLLSDLMRVLPVAVVVTLLIAGLAMRSVQSLLLPLLATTGAVICTVALFLYQGHAFNFVTIVTIPVIFILGFAYCIHVVTSIREELAGGSDRAPAIESAIRDTARTVTLNAGLEAVGFLSLAFSNLEAIRLFGLYAAVGIVLAWFGALVIVPAGIMLLPYRPAAVRTGNGLPQFATLLARFDLTHRRQLLWAGGLLTVGALAFIPRIQVGTDYLSIPPPASAIARHFQQASALFDGIVPLQILIESDVPGVFKDPAQLITVSELQRWLEAQPEVGKVLSLPDYLGVLYHAFVPDAPRENVIPPSIELTDQLLLLGAGNDVERFTDSRYMSTLLHVRVKPAATAELAPLITRIEARLATLPPHLHGHVTGSAVQLVRSIDDITTGQIVSLATTGLIIYLVLVVIFGSLRIGALALLPNVMPIVLFFGILGATGISLDVTTSLVAPIVLAIVIDDTVHFLARFNSEARRAASENLGIERAMAGTIRPVAYSTLGLTAGFLALGLSTLSNQATFGYLAAATMLLAWLLDLTFTPALASRMRFVTLWDTLSVDLGCTEPQKTIPLFHGLSARQARTAAILGSILVFKPGERIQAEGQPAQEIFVVIEGDLVATVPHPDGERELRHFGRGDLLGAASLFHGRHFANVEALTPVRVLRLGESCLGRIQDRYPRIGAQLYRNLSAIMAERLADVAVRL